MNIIDNFFQKLRCIKIYVVIIMKFKGNVLYKKKTQNGVLSIIDTVYDEEAVCFLMMNDTTQSGMYLDENKKYDLVFPYMQRFSYAFQVNPNIKKTFMIGGGALAYPKYYVSHYPEAEITCAETNVDIISAAFIYFGIKELDQELFKRIHIVNEDGITYLRSHEDTYDLIINDAFIGKKEQLRNETDIEVIKDKLNEDGIYIVNCSTAITGPLAKKGNKYRKLLQKHFEHVVMLVCEEDRNPLETQNVLLISSDKELL